MSRTCCIAVLLALALAGCSGADGANGKQGPAGDPGPQGPAGPGGGASVNAVLPSAAYLGGHAAGDHQRFCDELDGRGQGQFGAGVSVDSLQVASPTAIVADISVQFDASPGPRDVSVTDGSDTLVYKGAFTVAPPTQLVPQGNVAQGAILLARVQDLDFTRPFDATTQGDGLFTPITYPNIELSTDPGVVTQFSSAQAYSLAAVVLVDLDHPAGPAKLDVLSGPPGGTRQSFPESRGAGCRRAYAASAHARPGHDPRRQGRVRFGDL